ncbi:MAG: hypothetical protein AAF571_14310 [Verrucomicrobiota bacterium]
MVKFLKFVIALLLLPCVWVSVRVLYEIAAVSVRGELPWMSLVLFASGFLLWLLLYLTTNRLTSLYVFQHEATHALAVWTSGGKVSKFHVSEGGGHIVADRTSTWISLAPYILPLYPLITGLLWALLLWIHPPSLAWTPYFLFVWGIIWSFHFSFTISLLKTEQTDFSSQGYLFSWLIIALSNIWMLTLILWVWLSPMPLWQLLEMAGQFTVETYRSLCELALGLVQISKI